MNENAGDSPTVTNEWATADHAVAYLERAERLPHRTEGEAALLEVMPPSARRVLDLGTGDGRLLALVRGHVPAAEGVALDFSPTMLAAVRERFDGDPMITVVSHDLSASLPELGMFDAIVSSFVIHHLPHERKRALYEEIFGQLAPGGRFCNLEHVASPTERLHVAFLRAIGYVDVDCVWKWRELALLVASRPE